MSTADGQPGAGAVIITSAPLRPQGGPVAVWITAAGWAAAAQRALGTSWLVTPNGVLDPTEAIRLASRPGAAGTAGNGTAGWLPETPKTLLKDLREAGRAYRFRTTMAAGPWTELSAGFVWQRHDLFQSVGLHTARDLDLPFVVFVDAPVVWEARKWGVRRPGWGGLLERVGEGPLLRRADVVACVSDEVADEVERFGVEHQRVLVTPCGVDPETFSPAADGAGVRRRHGIADDRFVVGWTGSFRRFHGTEVLLDAAAQLRASVPELVLLLVGDGPERPRLEALARDRGIDDVVFAGTVSHDEIPAHLAAMDVAVLTAPADADFHYSPLKLKEYQAAARPVVAPAVGQVPSALSDGVEGLLVAPGDAGELAEALAALAHDEVLRRRLGAAARQRVQADGTWDHQVDRVLRHLRLVGVQA